MSLALMFWNCTVSTRACAHPPPSPNFTLPTTVSNVAVRVYSDSATSSRLPTALSGRGAPLSAPGRRTPDNLLGRIRDIGCCVHEGWVLAAQFKKNGSQILCCRLHDDLANLDAAGEEDEVEGQFEKLCHLVFAAGDGSDGPRIEIFRNEIE